MFVDDELFAEIEMMTKQSVPAAFTASETFDVRIDVGSPVSRDFAELDAIRTRLLPARNR